MRPMLFTLVAVTLTGLDGTAVSDDRDDGISNEGFITTWLLLAPIPLDPGQNGAAALGKQQLKDEARLQPRAGDKVKVGIRELQWKTYSTKNFFFDFNDFLGQKTEDSVGYAVCYVHAPADRKGLRLLVGSDDQAVVYLNGKQFIKSENARALERDSDRAAVSLNKGVNVLVFKVVNEKGDWSGCARFVDKDNALVNDLRARTSAK